MSHVRDVGDVKYLNKKSKTVYVGDVGDGANYIVYVMLFMSEMLKIYKHLFAHNLLNIQRIFNPEKVLKSWDIGLSNHTNTKILCNYCIEIFHIFELHCLS